MASHRQLAGWYQSLASSLEAGLPLLEALAAPGGPHPAQRAALVERLRHGASLEEALAREGAWLPAADTHLWLAGAAAGRLPATCRQLAAHRERAARLTTRAVLAAMYPLFLVNFGAFVLPLQHLVLGSVAAYAREVLGTLAALWLAAGTGAVVLGRHPGLRRRVFRHLPWISGYQRAYDLQVLSTVLEGYVAAGVGLEAAWVAAGRATGAPEWAALGQRLGAEAAAGRKPGARLRQEPAVPEAFVQHYLTGETTGKLDESLGWLARHYSEEAERALTHVSLWYPALAFLGTAVWVAVKVVRAYAAHLETLLKVMDTP